MPCRGAKSKRKPQMLTYSTASNLRFFGVARVWGVLCGGFANTVAAVRREFWKGGRPFTRRLRHTFRDGIVPHRR